MISYLQWEMVIWLLVALAIFLILFKQRIWPLPLGIGLLAAFIAGLLETEGTAIILAGLIAAYTANKSQGRQNTVLHLVVVLWALALATHLLPGFNNLMVLDQVSSGPQSQPFSLYFNLDKPMLIFAFLILVPQIPDKKVSLPLPPTMTIAALGLLIIPWLAWWFGLIRPELSVPDWIILFALNNLFMTCVAEEVFFRGYLHHILSRYGNTATLLISSLLFGLAHFPAGWLYVALAGLAGLCYGLIYLASGRLYWAILAHFLFNLYHLIFFTYPLANN